MSEIAVEAPVLLEEAPIIEEELGLGYLGVGDLLGAAPSGPTGIGWTVTPPLWKVAAELRGGANALLPLTRKAIVVATKQAREAVKQSALDTLPKSGALNKWVASASVRTSFLVGPRTAGVTIRARKTGHDLKTIDGGIVRHPVYGNPNVWAVTYVTPGFFTRPLRAIERQVDAAVLGVFRNPDRRDEPSVGPLQQDAKCLLPCP